MKRLLPILLVLVLLSALFAGCAGTTPSPSPSPAVTIRPSAAPSPMPSPVPSPVPSAAPSASPGMGEDTIPGFEEGKEVDEADVPAIVKAIEDRYKGAKIEKITYAMQAGKQTYCVAVRTSDDKSVTVYVAPDGTIVKTDAAG